VADPWKWHRVDEDEFIAANGGKLPAEHIKKTVGLMRGGEYEFWANERYLVHLYRGSLVPQDTEEWPPMVWLSIRNQANTPIKDWRDLQRIKNELVGEDHEAVELYPAESRLVDTANQYHLWCLASPKARFPFGYLEREVTDRQTAHSKQRAFDEPKHELSDDAQRDFDRFSNPGKSPLSARKQRKANR
jgi:hypothetical protein